MLAGDFARKLKQLNNRLNIYCLDDDNKPAGLFYVKKGEYIPICSVDKNEIPKHAVANEQNKILKSGWQRTLKILIMRKLVSKHEAERVFEPLDRCKVKIYKEEDSVARVDELYDKKRYQGKVDHNGQPIFNSTDILNMKAELDLRRD